MIQPLRNFLLVSPIEITTEREQKTASGIYVANPKANRVDTQVAKAKVDAVGKDVKEIEKGDTVYYNFFSGNSIITPGKDAYGKDDLEQHLVWEEDILAKETK